MVVHDQCFAVGFRNVGNMPGKDEVPFGGSEKDCAGVIGSADDQDFSRLIDDRVLVHPTSFHPPQVAFFEPAITADG